MVGRSPRRSSNGARCWTTAQGGGLAGRPLMRTRREAIVPQPRARPHPYIRVLPGGRAARSLRVAGRAHGKHDGEAGVAWFRFEADLAAVAPDDDSPGDVEPEASAL